MQLNIIYLNFRISLSIFFQKFSENNYFGNVLALISPDKLKPLTWDIHKPEAIKTSIVHHINCVHYRRQFLQNIHDC